MKLQHGDLQVLMDLSKEKSVSCTDDVYVRLAVNRLVHPWTQPKGGRRVINGTEVVLTDRAWYLIGVFVTLDIELAANDEFIYTRNADEAEVKAGPFIHMATLTGSSSVTQVDQVAQSIDRLIAHHMSQAMNGQLPKTGTSEHLVKLKASLLALVNR